MDVAAKPVVEPPAGTIDAEQKKAAAPPVSEAVTQKRAEIDKLKAELEAMQEELKLKQQMKDLQAQIKVFYFSTQTPISPKCRTPLFAISQKSIRFFRRTSKAHQQTSTLEDTRGKLSPTLSPGRPHTSAPHLRLG